MTAKKWMLLFLAALLLTAALWAGFNLVTDPYGVFGDRVLDFYGYNITHNPRVAKTAWLEQDPGRYDSFIIGPSGASSIPTGTLSEALDASFYNLCMYGADFSDVRLTAEYLVENYEVKNLVVSLYVDNAVYYESGEGDLNHQLHADVSGRSALAFYLEQLFLPPVHGVEKLKDWLADTEAPQAFDVFVPETGEYDKRERDAEPIGELSDYLSRSAYAGFLDYPAASYPMTWADRCLADMAAIKSLCDRAGVTLYVVCNPSYYLHLDYFDPAELADFFIRLADITPYWDFTYSSISCDPRYWYDLTHFRNSVGEMMGAVMLEDDSLYVPDDFGAYVTADSAAEHTGRFTRDLSLPESEFTARVPVLLYHHLDDTGEGAMSVTPETFRAHMEALKAAGYETVTLEELYDYVHCGASLPDKPVLITFDDGYSSNYDVAYPILRELDMEAVIFVIGVSVGKDTYKDTGLAMTPHFSWEEAREMLDSGLIDIQTHTYDLHQWAPLEEGTSPLRENALPLAGESEGDYIAAYTADLERAVSQLEANTGREATALAYPYGASSELTAMLTAGAGLSITFSTDPVTATLVRGLPQSLLGMGRYTVDDISPEELLSLIVPAADPGP